MSVNLNDLSAFSIRVIDNHNIQVIHPQNQGGGNDPISLILSHCCLYPGRKRAGICLIQKRISLVFADHGPNSPVRGGVSGGPLV